jgi:phospholipase/lecithinase/hemolysin
VFYIVVQSADRTITKYTNWNAALRSSVASFSAEYPEATTLIFSSYATFTRVLDDPVGHGFHDQDAAYRAGKGIWMDHLHPTSKMHSCIAKDMAEFLGTVARPVGAET